MPCTSAAAPHHLPPFITAPGETDYFYNGSAIFLLVMVIILGTLYFRLHALPEHLAHGNENKVQFQLVGVLALLALFTHNNVFWVAALLLALVRIPDLATPLARWPRPCEDGWREVARADPAHRPDSRAISTCAATMRSAGRFRRGSPAASCSRSEIRRFSGKRSRSRVPRQSQRRRERPGTRRPRARLAKGPDHD